MASVLISSAFGDHVPRRRARVVRVLKSRRGRGNKFGTRISEGATLQNQNIQIEEVPAGTFSLEEVRSIGTSYGSPQNDLVTANSFGSRAPASNNYGAPQRAALSSNYVSATPIQAPSSSFGGAAAPAPQRVASQYESPKVEVPSSNFGIISKDAQSQTASASSQFSVRQAPSEVKPVAILRSVFNTPGSEGFERTYDFSFEADNGISQESSGELKTINDSEVYVMRGSYSYTGADGAEYVVNWIADENGYRANAEHLPIAVEIPFEEQRDAVAAQIRFAQERGAAEETQFQKSYQ